jgi:hypothetical protein
MLARQTKTDNLLPEQPAKMDKLLLEQQARMVECIHVYIIRYIYI